MAERCGLVFAGVSKFIDALRQRERFIYFNCY